MENTKYLNRVLNKWGEFCRTHKNIEKAIRELLEENQQLKQRLSVVEGFIDAIEFKIDCNDFVSPAELELYKKLVGDTND